jgi:hypothetical protein
MNSRFLLSASASLTMVALGLLLVPFAPLFGELGGEGSAAAARGSSDASVVLLALVGIVTVSGCCALALFYLARKGDLNWLSPGSGGEGQTDARN